MIVSFFLFRIISINTFKMRILIPVFILLFYCANLHCQTSRSESGETLIVQRSEPRDSPWEQTLLSERVPLPYDHIREADVFWSRRVWRIIDVREKMNHTFQNETRPFISILLDAAEAGKVTAYSTTDDKFSIPLTTDDLGQLLYRKDTIPIIDPDTGDETYREVVDDFNPSDVKRFRIKEDWFFDSETSSLQVRILGIAPLMEHFDNFGNLKFETPLFWIYYPHAREVLAREKVFNPFNDSARISWEDLFEMRYFASAIWKVSDPLGRRVQDYKSGEQMMIEARRLSEEIFNFEHDLWSY